MPTLLENLKVAGFTIPEGVTSESVLSIANQSDEIKGLVHTKDELLQWKTVNKPLLETLQTESKVLKDKAVEDEKKALDLARQNGDYKAEAEIIKGQLEALTESQNAAVEQVRLSTHQASVQSIAALFDDNVLGLDVAQNKAETVIGDDGKPVTTYKLGSETFTDLDGLKGAMSKIPSYASSMIVGGESNDPAANGNNGNQHNQNSNSETKLSSASNNYSANLNQ